jgi:hypothetical protein
MAGRAQASLVFDYQLLKYIYIYIYIYIYNFADYTHANTHTYTAEHFVKLCVKFLIVCSAIMKACVHEISLVQP